MAFGTAGSERMRIDGSGNFLVAKTADTFSVAGLRTASNGATTITRSAGEVLNLNRTTSDGAILYFSQDGAT